MAHEVLLPKQGNSVESCIIVAWKVAEGDRVAEGDVLVEVETDKATMEVESTAAGVLLERLAGEGDDVPVLRPIAIVGEPGERVDDRTTAASQRRRDGAKVSPRARRLAEREGVDYETLDGSGPGGRVLVRDVEAARAAGSGAAGAAAASGTEREAAGGRGESTVGMAQPTSETRIAGVRKLIAERMHASVISTAQLTMDASADARALLDYRKRLKVSDDESLRAISINDLVLFAVSRVLRRRPELNATFADGVVRTFAQVDLGFAVDTPKGLMVPVVRAADRRSLSDVANEAHRLAAACAEGRVKPDELAGGTFSVTNLGAFGIERFTPVLNPPQVAILGVCAVTPRPAPDGEGTIPMIGLSLTIDHQVVDGAPAARFLQDVCRAIANVELTLAE
ncbi:MAG: dihydrolipoamide acetyltransferase family protein [Spirochaetota bacterium]